MKGVPKPNLQGIEWMPIQDAIELFPAYFTGRDVTAEHFLFVPKGRVVEEPIIWSVPQPLEIYVSKGAAAHVKIVPENDGQFDLHAYLEEGAELKRSYLGEKRSKMHLMSHYRLKKDARLTHYSWTEMVDFTEESVTATIEGEGAQVDLIGGWHLCEREKIQVKALVEHKAAYARSNQLFKGVVEESAFSQFEGSIYVASGAHKTESFQRNNNCVFGNAQAKTSPGIQVYHDDVKASHGATIAKPSKEDLFYLTSRGIHPDRAKALLIEAFLNEVRAIGAAL